jgi:hypothetical protein
VSDLLERFPIGSRWTDNDGDQHVVLGLDLEGPVVTTAFLKDGEWNVSSWNWIYEEFKPYVEPEPLPEFRHWGWIHGTTQTVRTGYQTTTADIGGKAFEYGIEAGELFIRWCG